MNKLLPLLLGISFSCAVFAQDCTVNVADYFSCEPTTLTIEGVYADTFNIQLNQYTVSPIAFSYTDLSKSPAMSVGDDEVIGPFPIGFDFPFFNNTYNQFWISSNGFISFLPDATTGYGASAMPNNNGPYACVFAAWEDWNPNAGGVIRFSTSGVAPNRQLVVEYEDVYSYNCGGEDGAAGSFQINLKESNGSIEIHTENKYDCTASLQAIQNSTGEFAFYLPGRNAENWSTSNDGIRFTPQSTATVEWFDSEGILLGEGGSLILDAAETADYTVVTNNGFCSFVDTFNVQVSLPEPQVTQSGDLLLCDLAGYAYQWTLNNEVINGAVSQYIFPEEEGYYAVLITDTNNCTVSSDYFSIDAVSVEEVKNGWTVYPMPSNGNFTVYSQSNSVLYIYNTLGGLVQKTELTAEVEALQQLRSGVYHAVMHFETGKTSTQKIIIY